jgi:DUF971 family protein
MISLSTDQKTPTNIEVDLKQNQVRIVWADGYRSVFSLEQLRRLCPCAVCNDLRRQQDADPLRVLGPDQAQARGELRADDPVKKVGNYALQFFWADGHLTGIYSYAYLRQISAD